MAISGYLPNEYEIVKYCDVDFSSQGVPSSVSVSQYDRKTVLLGIHLYNNSKPYYPPEGADAHLKVTLNDGTVVYNEVVGYFDDSNDTHVITHPDESLLYAEITYEMTKSAGDLYPVVEINTSDGTITSSPIMLRVQPCAIPIGPGPSPTPPGPVPTGPEDYIPILGDVDFDMIGGAV